MHSELYRINTATDANSVGVWPQVGELVGMSQADMLAFTKIRAVEELPASMPRLDAFRWEKGARRTNVLSFRYVPEHLGIVVDRKVQEIFADYQIGDHLWAPVGFASRPKLQGYQLLFLVPTFDAIHWAKSVFVETSAAGTKRIDEHTFKSEKDFRQNSLKVLSSITHGLRPAKVSIDEHYDVFRIPQDFSSMHISEKLAKSLSKAEITGIEIKKSELEFEEQ